MPRALVRGSFFLLALFVKQVPSLAKATQKVWLAFLQTPQVPLIPDLIRVLPGFIESCNSIHTGNLSREWGG